MANLQIEQDVLKLLQDCIAACQFCAKGCLEEKEVARLTRCIKLDLDCADVCTLTAALVARDSEMTAEAARLCIEVCENCAAECEKHAQMHAHCAACAKACRDCAQGCRKLAA